MTNPLDRANQKSIFSLSSVSYPKREQVKKFKTPFIHPSTLEIKSKYPATLNLTDTIQELAPQFILKNHPISRLNKAYQISLVLVIMSMEDVLDEKKISQTLCALACEEQGGVIFIAQQHEGLIIQSGFKVFGIKNMQQLNDLVQNALKLISNHNKILIKIEKISLKIAVNDALRQNEQEDFIIKISVAAKLQQKKMIFFIEQKDETSKSTRNFYKIQQISQGDEEKYIVKKIKENQVYDLMCNIAKRNLRSKTKIFPINNARIFKNPGHLFFLLRDMSKMGKQNMFNYFSHIKSHLTVAQLYIQGKEMFVTLEKLENFLQKGSYNNYRYWIPLSRFQKQYIGKQECYIFYLVLQQSYEKFLYEIREQLCDQFHKKLKINEVKAKIAASLFLDEQELQALQFFLWEYFESKPKIQRSRPISRVGIPVYRKVKFQFESKDKLAAAFTLLVLELTKKRPESYR